MRRENTDRQQRSSENIFLVRRDARRAIPVVGHRLAAAAPPLGSGGLQPVQRFGEGTRYGRACEGLANGLVLFVAQCVWGSRNKQRRSASRQQVEPLLIQVP